MDFSYFHPALPVQIAGGDFGLIDVVFTDLAVAQTNHAVRHVFDRIIVCYHDDGVASSQSRMLGFLMIALPIEVRCC